MGDEKCNLIPLIEATESEILIKTKHKDMIPVGIVAGWLGAISSEPDDAGEMAQYMVIVDDNGISHDINITAFDLTDDEKKWLLPEEGESPSIRVRALLYKRPGRTDVYAEKLKVSVQ
jgi:hypothetical protein